MLGQFGPQQNQSKYAKKMGDFAQQKANEAQQKTEELETVIDENRFNFKGDVPTRSAIPSSKEFGDAWFVIDEGATVRWNGTALELRNTNNPSQIQKLAVQLAETEEKLNRTLYWFEAPEQPSFNIQESGAIWDGDGQTISSFRDLMIDPLVANAPDYVTKTLLGRDASDSYDIFEYVFEPEHYEQTILLGSGMHGRETVPVYSMYRLMHYLINEPDIHPDIQYLRSKVRIVMLPALGIWSSSSNLNPKQYWNYNGINISRNFPINWELLPYYNYPTIEGRGLLPLNQSESQILYNWFLKYKDTASFYMDMHTDYSFYGGLPSKDFWVLTSDNPHMINVLEQCASYLDERVRKLYKREPVTLIEKETYFRSTHMMYPNDILGIPSCALEYCETRFGGKFAGSIDIQNHLTLSTNLIIQMVKYNFIEKKKLDSIEDSTSHIKSSIKSFHALNDELNAAWTLSELYGFYDKFVTDYPTNVAKTVISKDTSNTYDILKYVFTPIAPSKTILLYADAYNGVTTAKGTYLLAKLMELIYKNPEGNPVLQRLKDEFRFVVIPTSNPWGFNQGTQPDKSLRTALPTRNRFNVNNVSIYKNFNYNWLIAGDGSNGASAMSEVETQAIETVLGQHTFNATIGLGTLYDLVHIRARSVNNLYNEFLKSYNSMLPYRNPNKIRDIKTEISTTSTSHGYMSQVKNIPDSISVFLGDDTFAAGTPVYNLNKVEMQRHSEAFITALYNYTFK